MAVPSPPSPSKSDLRAAALAARRDYARSLGADMRARLEAQLAALLLPHLISHLPTRDASDRPFAEAEVIGGYHPMRDEISPLPLLDIVKDHGRLTALPWFAGRDARMMYRANPAEEIGPWGVLQPSADAAPALPSLVLVPLVLVDRHGTRIGHGKGHYDRALAHLRASGPVKTIGLAWDIQVSEEPIPADPWDIPLDAVATPTQWILTR